MIAVLFKCSYLRQHILIKICVLDLSIGLYLKSPDMPRQRQSTYLRIQHKRNIIKAVIKQMHKMAFDIHNFTTTDKTKQVTLM